MTSPGINWPWVKKELFRIEKIKDPVSRQAEECLLEAKSLVKPVVISAKLKISCAANGLVELEGRKTLSSKILASHIKGAARLYIFLVTIGKAIEESASNLMKEGESLKGYLMDRIGSLAVESMAMALEEKTREDHKKSSESVSMRFSPGYCDWLIEEQRVLAEILDFSKAGVRLTEKCMMEPKKSISAVVAAGPRGLFKETKSQCGICGKKEECHFRR